MFINLSSKHTFTFLIKTSLRFFLLIYFSPFFSTLCYSQNNTAPITKVRPFLKGNDYWDENMSLPSGEIFTANGMIPTIECKKFNEDPKNSCAARIAMSPVTTSILSFKGFIDKVSTDLGIVSPSETYNKLEDMLKAFNQYPCDNYGMKACVIKDRVTYNTILSARNKAAESETSFKRICTSNNHVFTMTKLDMKLSDFPECKKQGKQNACFISELKYNLKANKIKLDQKINSCNEHINTSLGNFANYNKNEKVFSQLYIFHPSITLDVSSLKKEIENLPAAPESEGDLSEHFYFSSKTASVAPIVATTGDQLNFVINTPTLVGSTAETDFKNKIRTYLRVGNTTPTTTTTTTLSLPRVYKFSKIKINSSSSTPSNNANFCQKDFVGLSKSRALKIKKLIIDALTEEYGSPPDPTIFADIYFSGTNLDGTSGNCAYRCAGYSGTSITGISPPPASGECVEIKIANYNSTPFTAHQKVSVNLDLVPLENTSATATTEYTLDLKVPVYRLHVGCKFDELKSCYDDITKNGKTTPGNLIK